MVKLLSIGALAIGLIAVGVYAWNASAGASPDEITIPPDTAIPLDVPIETTTLSSASDQSAEGAATRQFIDQLFVHGITAYLPDPPSGQFYAGWLMRNENRADAVSTGKLVKSGDTYTLDFSSPADYTSYSGVLVTLQSGEHQPPGTDVLTGAFPVK